MPAGVPGDQGVPVHAGGVQQLQVAALPLEAGDAEILLCCSVAGAERPLGLAVQSCVHGLAVSYDIQQVRSL